MGVIRQMGCGLAAVCLMATALPAMAESLPWRQKPVTLDQQKVAIEREKSAPKTPKPVMGWIELAHLPDIKQDTRAKLDSGAKTSAINADVIKIFRRGKKEYVLFRIDLDRKYDAKPIERKVVRWVKIKLKQGGLQKRPVVKLNFCIGNTMLDGEVSLAKRDHFNYNILVGRNMLQNRFVIDASRTFTVQPHCQ